MARVGSQSHTKKNNNIPYAHRKSPTRAVCPAKITLRDWIIVIMITEIMMSIKCKL